MLKKESALLKMAKVIVIVSSIIGIVTVWGMSYYMLMAEMNQSQIPNNQVVLTQSTCAKITENKLGQGDCYFKVAKARRNESICGKIEIAELKSLCLVELAEVKNDFSICENNEIIASLMAVCEDYFSTEEGSSDIVSDSSDMDDWKTYQNDVYGYSLSYPADWKITVTDIDPSAVAENDLNKLIGDVHGILFNDEAVQGPVFVLEVMSGSIDNAIAVDKTLYGTRTGKSVIIGGIVGEKLSGAFYGMQYVNKNGRTYFFEQQNAGSDGDIRDFDKVMKSFKFIGV